MIVKKSTELKRPYLGDTYRRALHPGLRRAGTVGEDRGTVHGEGRPEGAFNTSRTRQGSFQKQVSQKKKKRSRYSREVRSFFTSRLRYGLREGNVLLVVLGTFSFLENLVGNLSSCGNSHT